MHRKIKHFIFNSIPFLTICYATSTMANQNQSIQGYWAMQPLNNGIANVVHFDQNNTSTLYSFQCDFKYKTASIPEPPEVSNYVIENNSIHLIHKNSEYNQTLNIKKLEKNRLVLEQGITSDFKLSLSYQRVDRIKNLCPTL